MKRLFASFSVMILASLAATTAAAAGVPYHEVGRVAGRDGGWDYSVFDAATGRLYLTHANAVSMLDVASGKFTDLAPAQHGHQVLVLDHGRTLFETDGGTNLGRFIDAHSGAVLAQVPAGMKPDAALLDPVTGLLAVIDGDVGMISLIDPVKRAAVGGIHVGGVLEYAVADGKGSIFTNIEDGNAIAHIDLAARKLVGRFALPGCEGPTGLALVANGTRLISACANKVALVVDAVSGATLATLPIGEGPDAVLADEARRLAFIPCGGSGTLVELSLADPDHIAVIGTIATQKSARNGAIDPRDGRIYLPVARFNPPQPGQRRGTMVPGSFAVLVLAPGA